MVVVALLNLTYIVCSLHRLTESYVSQFLTEKLIVILILFEN